MTARGEAPGKVILVGEHAVVYGRPAIAVPVWEARAIATVSQGESGGGFVICAHDLKQEIRLTVADGHEPLAMVARLCLQTLGLDVESDWRINLRSDIPIASGMGSGAAVSAAVVRAMFAAAGVDTSPQIVSRLVFASEKVHHGTPSGIDNTVVAYGQPVWFVRGQEPEPFVAQSPFVIVVADSGVPASTREMVDGVRQRRRESPNVYDAWFDEIGAIAQNARAAIEGGDRERLGSLFNQNQTLLERIGVSTTSLEKLVNAAREAGALGAKLSGGGGGGNVIALVRERSAPVVRDALLAAGSTRVIVTTVTAAT